MSFSSTAANGSFQSYEIKIEKEGIKEFVFYDEITDQIYTLPISCPEKHQLSGSISLTQGAGLVFLGEL